MPSLASYTPSRSNSRGGEPSYFGTGSLGNVTVSSNTTFGTGNDDSACLISNFRSLTVNSGVTISPAGRRRAWIIYVQDDLNLQGIASMGKGAASPATKIVIMRFPLDPILGPTNILAAVESVPAVGGAGAAKTTVIGPGNVGTAGINGQTGGGGAGAGDSAGFGAYGNGGAGSTGTAYSGGSGGGGGGYNEDTTGSYVHGGDAAGNGGAGGAAADSKNTVDYYVSAGGAGNPGGTADTGVPSTVGNDGTGGVIIFIVGGNITYGAASFIKANGTPGGDAINGSTSMYAAFGGGGSGAGRAITVYAGTLTDSGLTTQANGGAGGAATATSAAYHGGAGGAGSISSTKINTNN